MTTPPPVHDDVALLVVTVVVTDGLNTENFVAVVVAPYCRPPPAFNDDLAVIVTSGFGDGPRETFILEALEAAAAANTSAIELLKVSGMAPELDSELLNSCALLLRCGGPVITLLLLIVQLAAVSLNSLARLGVADTSAAAAEAATVDGLAGDDS